MVDPNGTLKWYQWLGIVGAVLVVAAATILTCGAAGVAIGGAGLAGAVVHGAAVGALIGAGIGAVGGAIGGGIYSAVTGADFWSSVGAGAMAGLGIGAIVGAVVGGFVGAFHPVVSQGATASIGSPFNPNQSYQIGVDPNTLTINRTLNPSKIQAVIQRIKTSGMYGEIVVNRNGMIIDGNHRVYVARLLKIAVDVIIK